MNKRQKKTVNAFSLLVKQKLKERGWSQSYLGQRIDKGRTYMTYLVRGESRNGKGGQLNIPPDVIEAIARELGIATDEAFQAAGLERPQPPEDINAPVGREPNAIDAGSAAVDRRLMDLARLAAQEALRMHEAGETPVTGVSQDAIIVDLPDGAKLVLSGAGELTDDETGRLSAAFSTAYETVRKVKSKK